MTIANHTQPILVIIDCATDFEAELLWQSTIQNVLTPL